MFTIEATAWLPCLPLGKCLAALFITRHVRCCLVYHWDKCVAALFTTESCAWLPCLPFRQVCGCLVYHWGNCVVALFTMRHVRGCLVHLWGKCLTALYCVRSSTTSQHCLWSLNIVLVIWIFLCNFLYKYNV